MSDQAYIQQLEAENASLKATLAQVMEYVKELEVKVEELSKKLEQQSVKRIVTIATLHQVEIYHAKREACARTAASALVVKKAIKAII